MYVPSYKFIKSLQANVISRHRLGASRSDFRALGLLARRSALLPPFFYTSASNGLVEGEIWGTTAKPIRRRRSYGQPKTITQ